ncbi:MAG: prephenate dehydrogenase/arogenate dehydrogenase family protein, partial [Patescibacteria group bacterium]
MPKTIGIIGNKGGFGRWFTSFFKKRGDRVIGSDIGTQLSNQMVTKQADIILVCVPFSSFEKVVSKDIIPFSQPHQLLMDVMSLKMQPMEIMMRSQADVVGLHPMWAPKAKSAQGQRCIVIAERLNDTHRTWLDCVLHETGMVLTHSTSRRHDECVSLTQPPTQALSLALVGVMNIYGVPLAELNLYSSPFSRLHWSLIGRMLSQKSEVYADILMNNPRVPELLCHLEEEIQSIRQIVQRKDYAAFEALFMEAREYFGVPHINTSSSMFDDMMLFNVDMESINQIQVSSKNAPGLLHKISKILDRAQVDLTSFHSKLIKEKDRVKFHFGYSQGMDPSAVASVVRKIKRISNP